MLGLELVVIGAALATVGRVLRSRSRHRRLLLARETMPYPAGPVLETDGDRAIDLALRSHLLEGEVIEQQALVQDSAGTAHFAALTNARVMVMFNGERKARSVRREQIADVEVIGQRMIFHAKGASANLIVPPEVVGISPGNQETFLVAVARLFQRRDLPRAIATL